MSDPCTQCGGVGLIRRGNGSYPCSCQFERQQRARLNRIRIPAKFEHATLENYVAGPQGLHALTWARRYVDEYIPGKTATGLLFFGSVGVGKTHLAVGILRKLAEEKGIEGRMVDIRELLDQLRSSYDERNERSQESQAQVLASILKAELILIDELGAAKPSDWVYETLELLIGTLYNRARPVIVTTNMGNRGPFNPGNRYEENEYARAARAETLGDRIGLRMWSRLQQMCRPVEINGSDWRQQR